MKKQSQLTAALIAIALILSCGGDDDVEISVSIAGITNITATSAHVTVNYASGNVSVVEAGVVYGTTPGRLNIRTIISGGEPNMDYGVVSTPASLSGKFYADLENLADGTQYFIAPFVKLDRATSEFPDGYFLPLGYKEFKTVVGSGSAPAISNTAVSEISYTSARFEAMINPPGDPSFQTKGFCYGPAAEPMQNDGVSVCVPVYGPEYLYSATAANLSGSTAYNVRAYVSNNRHATQYGAAIPFRTTGGGAMTLTDERDGQTYRIMEADRFTWMAENLNYSAPNSWCYGDDGANCAKYGRLYTWAAATTACPAGWRLPTRAEWNILVNEAGGAANAGKILKSALWDGTDNLAFSALPGGYRDRTHVRVYIEEGNIGRWWVDVSQTYRSMQTGNNGVTEGSGANHEYSVRCIKEW